VRFVVHGEVSDVAYCHCRMCQRATGAPVMVWARALPDAVRLTGGQPAVLPHPPHGDRTFCQACGTTLLAGPAAGPLSVAVATLDTPVAFPPRHHDHTGDRLPWLRVGDGLPSRVGGERTPPGWPVALVDAIRDLGLRLSVDGASGERGGHDVRIAVDGQLQVRVEGLPRGFTLVPRHLSRPLPTGPGRVRQVGDVSFDVFFHVDVALDDLFRLSAPVRESLVRHREVRVQDGMLTFPAAPHSSPGRLVDLFRVALGLADGLGGPATDPRWAHALDGLPAVRDAVLVRWSTQDAPWFQTFAPTYGARSGSLAVRRALGHATGTGEHVAALVLDGVAPDELGAALDALAALPTEPSTLAAVVQQLTSGALAPEVWESLICLVSAQPAPPAARALVEAAGRALAADPALPFGRRVLEVLALQPAAGDRVAATLLQSPDPEVVTEAVRWLAEHGRGDGYRALQELHGAQPWFGGRTRELAAAMERITHRQRATRGGLMVAEEATGGELSTLPDQSRET
jgi:hypothetical protein